MRFAPEFQSVWPNLIRLKKKPRRFLFRARGACLVSGFFPVSGYLAGESLGMIARSFRKELNCRQPGCQTRSLGGDINRLWLHTTREACADCQAGSCLHPPRFNTVSRHPARRPSQAVSQNRHPLGASAFRTWTRLRPVCRFVKGKWKNVIGRLGFYWKPTHFSLCDDLQRR